MADLEILPVDTQDGTAWFFQRVYSLDGSDYILEFSYNNRDNHYYLTIKNEDGSLLSSAVGIRLVNKLAPLRRVTDPNRPKGEIFIFGEASGDPDLRSLGVNFLVYYIPEELLSEWRASV